ncbi:glycerophosphodiester phosphodiesterase family protein [Parasedimentitalea huanghaiensis]|uniref:Glycerophosphodiester phosphodiesterase n=1 Tax=Parasedimentitalea huanghaiensis TaxID=2682100 RepID=A0A6L6WFN4_9RHOB|nr:glycerophosphodiester phosphodiesterase family protein [Zongyanglinia huanghaiensis]MVO15415.1 glycerophosphodiester phosphodiesterase [Zongyanglinia huanghaiensis]
MTAMPKVFGHRGAPVALPENTLEGFQYAIDTGADGLELDLLLTRDGIPVVTHNPRLSGDTTRNSAGEWLQSEGPAISALTLEELRQFDVGGIRPGSDCARKTPHQAVLPNCRIPTLTEFLLLMKDNSTEVELLVELKHSPTASDQVSADTFVQIVADELRRHGMVEQSYLHAFNWQILSAAARSYPQLRRSHLSLNRSTHTDGTLFPGSPWLDGLDPEFAALPELLSQSGAAIWSPYFRDLDRESLMHAQEQGLKVMTWTVNDKDLLRAELQLGVDGIITDDPKLALALRDDVSAAQGHTPTLEDQLQ